MNWAFDDPVRLAALTVSIQRWSATPFCQHQCVAGAGVDCVGLVRAVWRDCGIDVAPAAQIPRYGLAAGVHQPYSALLDWLRSDPAARERLRWVDPDGQAMAGDIVVIRRAASAHHVGLLGPEDHPRLWHAAPGIGVCSIDWPACRANLKIAAIIRHVA